MEIINLVISSQSKDEINNILNWLKLALNG